jgi:hypothetical protein
METGLISEVIDGQGFYVFVPFPHTYQLEQKEITEVFVDIPDPRKHSPEQHKKVFGLINEITRWSSGYIDAIETEYIRKNMTANFCYLTGRELFSMSDADMTTVYEFITYLIDFCVLHDVPCQDNTLLGYSVDISRYIYACIAARKCCICGETHCDIHHCDGSRVGIGNNRNKVHHLGRKCMPLCRKHHSECESIGQATFNAKYHVYGIKLDEYLCKKIGWRI